MTGCLMILLIGSLLQGTNCNTFKTKLPQTVQVMTGSCVTVPCSFDVEQRFEQDLHDTCEAIWCSPKNVPQLSDRSPKTGNLTMKNCTTTFNNMTTFHTKNYHFRIDCKNDLKYSFIPPLVKIVVTDHFPSPTLTPSTLKIKEGELVSLMCSAPAPCLPHPPNLTWTPTLGDIQETLQENPDKTKFKTSVMNFTASHLHHEQNISCTAAYKKQDGSSDAAFTTPLIPDVLFPSRILFSSKCMKTSNQVNCSCETAGNPSPTTHWYLNGKPVIQSSQMVITHDSVNSSYMRSIITVDEPQDRDLSTLQCFSSNSLGSARKEFCVSCLENSRENEGQIWMPLFIATVVVFLLIVCTLLLVIGFQKTHYKPKSVTAASGQHGAKEQTTADNRQPSTGTDLSSNHPEKMSKSSADKSEDVLKWRKNNTAKEEDIYVNLELSHGSCLNEKKCENGGERSVSNEKEVGSLHTEDKTKKIRKESEVVYAQVKFWTKTPESQ